MKIERTHTVRSGEHLASIAKQYGFRDWRVIYRHPANAALRARRPNPHILLPGDTVMVPAKEIKIEMRPTGNVHLFRCVARAPLFLRTLLRDDLGNPLKLRKCTLKYQNPAGKWVIETVMTTDAGVLEKEIEPETEEVIVSINDQVLSWKVRIGHLDPALDHGKPVASGALSRLTSLGFFGTSAGRETVDPRTAAIRAFQVRVLGRKNATGELDPDTCRAVEKEYGC